MPYLQFIKAYLHARKLKISRKASYNHAKMFLREFDVIWLGFWVIIALVSLVLHYKDTIDGHNSVVARLNAKIKHEHRQAVKNELYVVALLNGRIKIDGKVASFCQKDVAGNCKG
jgi:hypothetical protein